MRRWTIRLDLGEDGVRPITQKVFGPATGNVEVVPLSEVKEALLGEAVYEDALDRIAAERKVHPIGLQEAIRHALDAAAGALPSTESEGQG